jgi:hypothetical protein
MKEWDGRNLHYMVEILPKEGEARQKYDVVKLVKDSKSGEWVEEVRYRATEDWCSCPGFEFRGNCKHLAYVREERLETKALELGEARKVASKVMETLEPVFYKVRLEADPYERDDKGRVTKIRMECLTTKSSKTAKFYVLSEGVLVRIVVKPVRNGG